MSIVCQAFSFSLFLCRIINNFCIFFLYSRILRRRNSFLRKRKFLPGYFFTQKLSRSVKCPVCQANSSPAHTVFTFFH
ncbi:hypothetical protein BACCAP_01088 [Pseudoflavonifractor capillosus ATCC 29799]|uniref:Uncharacterized protein n=1 Tax=Pseudoflavonifractor capillosus ATCC 29799 TaxID=411467 RepID=A6NSA9_9FIRM|nr:hypothetical protein BACCAP_01088 [Pseudoflavonifractor capillosus ATCC 29799]